MPGPAVVVLARAPDAPRVKAALAPALGEDGARRVQAWLLRHTLAWALAARAPAVVAVEPTSDDALAAVRALAPAGATALTVIPQQGETFGARLTHAAAAAPPGPLLITGVDAPALGPWHAAAARGDLEVGCVATIGPALAGGFYLLGLAEVPAALGDVPDDAWRTPDQLGAVLGLAGGDGRELGLLRPERTVHAEGDVRAFLADPGTPPDLRALLTRNAG